MALYTTSATAATRLARWAGVVVPSTSGTPSPMADLIAEASGLIEEFIGYAWEAQDFTELIPISRDGNGRLRAADALLCPVQSVSEVSVPANAQYYGPTITLSMVEWSSDGAIVLAFPIVYSPQRWVNPIPLGRAAMYNSALKLYPDELSVTFSAGRLDSPAPAVQDVCIRLMAYLLLQRDDPDSLFAIRQKVEDLGTNTQYRDDPIAEILRPISRYKR
jgi:hypothetical protein